MKALSLKCKLIFYPYLLVAVAFILVYTFLNWSLLIQTNFIHLREDIVTFWLPFTLPWIPVLIWLRPRTKLLKFKKDNAYFAFQFLMLLAIAAPTMVAQRYLATATGKLTKLDSPAQFEKAPNTKYYSLNTYFIDRSHAGFYSTATVSGKYNDHLDYAIYLVMPVLENTSDTGRDAYTYWIGKKYTKQVSNHSSEEQKQSEYTEFANQTEAEVDSSNFQQFIYLEKMGFTEDRNEFYTAVQKSPLASAKVPIIFTEINASFDKRNGDKLAWIFIAFGIGTLVLFVFLFFSPLDESNTNKIKTGISISRSDLRDSFGILIPKPGFYATAIILDLNILIYLLMVMSGLGVISFKAEDLVIWGGNIRTLTTHGEWWRLLTSTFLHAGLMHLAANMIGLLFVGIFLEPVLGRIKFILIYLITGILASCASIYWHPLTVSIGASGAIFGMYGTCLALILLKAAPNMLNRSFLVSILIFVGYNLLMGMSGGVDNAAHVGGLVSGFVIGSDTGFFMKRQEGEEGGSW